MKLSTAYATNPPDAYAQIRAAIRQIEHWQRYQEWRRKLGAVKIMQDKLTGGKSK
jgi:uncharacterized protein YjiS (DUF1127 family)